MTLMLSCISNFLYSQNIDSINFKTKEIKVFGNKIITNKFNSPIKIQTITNEQIQNKNGESLASVLQLATGVFIKSYGGNASLSTISLNGLGSEHTLVLLNGFKLNSSQNAQIDLSSVSKDNIERIEVMNNGSSSLYGSEAIGGVVNIITKSYLTDFKKDITIFVNGQIGSYNQRKLQMSLSKQLSNLNLDFNFSKEEAKNNYEYYYNNGIEYILKERLNSEYNISNFNLNLNYKINKNSDINFYSDNSISDRNIPGLETGSTPSNTNQTDNNWNSVVSFQSIVSNNTVIKSQLNYQNNLQNYTNRTFINSYYKNIYFANSSQVDYTKNIFDIITGYEISYATLKSNEVDDNIKRFQTSLFLVSEVNISRRIKLFPSVRFDNISDIDRSIVSGKLGINIKPFEKQNLNFKASSGNNFASPTFNELYWRDLGNRFLNPETSVNLDAGLIYGFNLFSNNTIEITYTNINANDKIIWSPNSRGIWTPGNIGKSFSEIFSLDLNMVKEISYKLNMNLDIKCSYTNSVKKSSDYGGDPTYDKQIFYIPNQLIKINYNINYSGTGMNLFYSYTGKRFTDFENKNYLRAVNLIEGNIYQNFTFDKITTQLKLEVNNILNKNYQIISGYPMELRNFKLSLSLQY